MARLLINVSACISFSALTLVVWWQEGHVPRKIPHFSELFSSRTSRGGPDRNSLTLVHPEKWQLNSSGNRMKFINTRHLLSLLNTQMLELLMYHIHQWSEKLYVEVTVLMSIVLQQEVDQRKPGERLWKRTVRHVN